MKNMIRYNANICVNFYGQIAKKKRIEAYVKNVIRYFCPNIRRVINVDITSKTNLIVQRPMHTAMAIENTSK